MAEDTPPTAPTLNRLIADRLSRRDFFGLVGGTAATLTLAGTAAAMGQAPDAAFSPATGSWPNTRHAAALNFSEIAHRFAAETVVAPGYAAKPLLRWGDRLSGAPLEGPLPRDREEQTRAFGTNCDYIAFMPLPLGSNNSDHGLLCVNHEYSWPPAMFPGFTGTSDAALKMSESQTELEMAAIGHSIVEVKRDDDAWTIVVDSAHNRRITPFTEMEMTGPAAGHKRLQTRDDPTGRRVLGTFANCAGGTTPWGTVLSAEENVQDYFYGDLRQIPDSMSEEVRNHTAMGIGELSVRDDNGVPLPLKKGPRSSWYRFHDRFDLTKEPREANRFGYVVEIDPYDRGWTPKKRTALGRYRHECACVHAEEGKPVAVYSTDDAYNQFIYRFVSKGVYRAAEREANRDLLSEGTLYVAKFNEDGTGEWLKIAFQEPWLTPERSGLKDEADLYIETRFAAKLLGATPMDRPEDIEISPLTGRFYVTLTMDPGRKPETVNAANPRAENKAGHIIEILPPGEDGARDHLADGFNWDIFLLAGDPRSWNTNERGLYNPKISDNGWFINPDNLAFDPDGRLWIATDGFNDNRDRLGGPAPVSDGLWACETTGPDRARTKCFFLAPQGAESTGPTFTPDGRTLFVSIQHPGVGGPFTVDKPINRWPDFDRALPPRSSVIAITRKDGGKIGT